MANTISILSYANTFGEWMVNTNENSRELNNLAKGTYTKDSGILILNGSNVSLQVSNTALFTGNVIISGANTRLTTQYLTVVNDEDIGGNLTVAGTTTTGNLVVTGEITGTAIINLRQSLADDTLAIAIALG